MLLGTVTKQPGDRLDIDVDFSEWLAERGGDALNLVTSSVAPAGLELLNLSHDSGRVKQWIGGGLDSTMYQLTLTASTTGGRVKEVEIRVRVREV